MVIRQISKVRQAIEMTILTQIQHLLMVTKVWIHSYEILPKAYKGI